MDFEAHSLALVRHYAEMARNPGAIDQARWSVAWLQRTWPEVFGDLGERVKRLLNE